ncbi:hypothetical protein CDL15_Pgr012638 [Punica granatum]|uniref:Uncharacterized protein n=1 Tax=Punica granatum TaxID=22663 RepID=A0A218WT57_PUNGR|nr:hypothetical protein CDL15_Pgr012638 [Punica granatum]PKI58373.1 hypothetical protein CRG98_021248 [Punica granatum]
MSMALPSDCLQPASGDFSFLASPPIPRVRYPQATDHQSPISWISLVLTGAPTGDMFNFCFGKVAVGIDALLMANSHWICTFAPRLMLFARGRRRWSLLLLCFGHGLLLLPCFRLRL